MIDFLKWVLSDFWRFAGALTFLIVIAWLISSIVTQCCLAALGSIAAIATRKDQPAIRKMISDEGG
jgi:purine-cytosine permease-like protein